ncbi:acetyltransferase [Pedobacter boryungensis]|uniref:Acetyltransferase n=1 Tax=Pedobacter boryungensis TaxID=869962 RepID=A0ABX2DGS1_9SPHI|nr:acetyltransferase [Pedobacter boryungensis]NQX32724.1 acetyltransferase [Pedobacter boryungensis]
MHIIGAGGQARVIIDILIAANQAIEGVWDESTTIKAVLNQPVRGNLKDFKASGLHPFIIAIGNNLTRKKIAEELNVGCRSAIHPKSAISALASIGVGTVVMANASVNVGTTIGKHVIINTNASVDHDCHIGDYAHVSPQAGIGGGVYVGEGTHIGIGASVKHGVKIGKWAIVGAGAVVIKDVPDYAVIVGNPGRILKYNPI